MRTDEVLSLLNGVKKQGDGWTARCPAHQDRHASLSVKEGRDGTTLLHCHAGCDFEQITASLRVNPKELFGDDVSDTTTLSEPELVYPYHDEEGTILYEVVRYPGKKFRQRGPNGEKTIKGIDRVLFRLPQVIEQARKGGHVVIAEGEKDVLALEEAGLVATCNSGGAGKWKDEFSQYLVGAQVRIIVDKDEPGRLHAQQVRDSLRKVGVEPKMYQAKKGKDAYDHLSSGLKPKDFIPVREGRLSGVVTSDQMADNALKALRATPESRSFYANPWGLDEPEFVPGRLYIVGGWTSGGKSAIAAQVYRHLSENGVRVGLVSNEMTEADFRNRILCHMGFNLKQLERPWTMTEENKARLIPEIEKIRGWNSEIVFDTGAGAKKTSDYLEDGSWDFVIFDHMHNIDAVRGGEESVINKEIGGFASLALDHDVPVLVVGQLRRLPPGLGTPKPNLQDFKGSGAIEQNAYMAMSVWRENKQSAMTELHILKNRGGRADYVEYLNFVRDEYRFEKGVPGGV